MKKAFTIVELLVAMALLAMMMAISSMVFAAAVKAYRTAGAAAEIAAKLSTLTNRLDRDFQSLPAAMPMAVWFEQKAVDENGDGIIDRYDRYDQIQFFSDGDNFESSKQWTYTTDLTTTPYTTKTETLSGNTARIYYGQANNVRIDSSTLARTPCNRNYNCSSYSNAREMATESILARRAHLLGHWDLDPTGQGQGQFPVRIITATTPYTLDYTTFQLRFIPWSTTRLSGNDVFEYDDTSLTDWINILSNSTNVDQYLKTSFANPDLANINPIWKTGGRPGVDLTASDGQSLHMILAQGVGSFSIQLAYMSGGALYWWPSQDPNGDGIMTDSDFTAMGAASGYFGYYLNFLSDPSAPLNSYWYKTSNRSLLTTSNYPQAIKFTFTLYDSNGVFKDGKTFTHIVYLND